MKTKSSYGIGKIFTAVVKKIKKDKIFFDIKQLLFNEDGQEEITRKAAFFIKQKHFNPHLFFKKEKIVDKRMRKLSILLTLGVLLIVIAGAIFATSTWEVLDGFVKTCVLIVVSLLFFGISGLAENKLKLKKSAITLRYVHMRKEYLGTGIIVLILVRTESIMMMKKSKG